MTSAEIDRPAAKVFACVTNPAQFKEWQITWATGILTDRPAASRSRRLSTGLGPDTGAVRPLRAPTRFAGFLDAVASVKRSARRGRCTGHAIRSLGEALAGGVRSHLSAQFNGLGKEYIGCNRCGARDYCSLVAGFDAPR